MANHQQRHSSKSLKWLSNKTLKLNLNLISFPSRRSPKNGSAASTLNSPTSYPNTPRSNPDDDDIVPKRDQSDELRRVFSRFDGDGDGKISAYELRAYFGSVGEHITHESAQEVIDEVDSDGDGFLGFEDFFGLMNRRDLDGGDSVGDLKTAFEMFELEKGSGCITPKGLQKMLARLGEVRSFSECEAMIRVYDTDGNGVLDFQEFHHMMTV